MTSEQAFKLKRGDKVIVTTSSDNFTKNKIYTVKEVTKLWLIVEIDDNKSNTNGLHFRYFELAYPTIFNNKLEEIVND